MMSRLKLITENENEMPRKFIEISEQELIKFEVNFKLAYGQLERDTKLHHK